MPNRLANETSPYLLQHANNPVDWYPWGPEALERARALDRPIMLSVGYAACHWCHVMERESFDDQATAAVMNERFVCIKVDREERPDIDQIYMNAVQAMTGHGGWPMTVFLTPEGKPFWGGTYFPDEPRHGMPSFRQVLDAIHASWNERRDGVLAQSDEVTNHLATLARAAAGHATAEPPDLDGAARAMIAHHDDEWGGFGAAPKFPQPMNLEFLLRAHLRGVDGALPVVTHTLDRMARGGMFDQLGGGFHRYSVDRLWLVPHFEKMLYDNAQLLRLYTRAWQVARAPLYQRTALMTAEWLLDEMQQPEGGFSSSLDADSEGEEGTFYVWPYDELIAVSGDDMPVAVAAFAASGPGNWEGSNVLWRPDDDQTVAEQIGMDLDTFRVALDRVTERLMTARARRIRPATDDKVLSAWNGMTIAALAEAGRVFGRRDLIDAAVRAADFVTSTMVVDGRLHRSWRAGRTSGPAFLDDHAAMADAALTLYETTFDPRWWRTAEAIAEQMELLFADPGGGYFDAGSDAEATLVRPKDVFDNAVPSGNASAADVLLRLAALSGDEGMAERAMAFPRSIADVAVRSPLGFGTALSALDRGMSGSVELALIGPPGDLAVDELAGTAWSRFIPNLVVAAGAEGLSTPALLSGRTLVGGRPAAYVCRRFTCRLPVTTPQDLDRELASLQVHS